MRGRRGGQGPFGITMTLAMEGSHYSRVLKVALHRDAGASSRAALTSSSGGSSRAGSRRAGACAGGIYSAEGDARTGSRRRSPSRSDAELLVESPPPRWGLHASGAGVYAPARPAPFPAARPLDIHRRNRRCGCRARWRGLSDLRLELRRRSACTTRVATSEVMRRPGGEAGCSACRLVRLRRILLNDETLPWARGAPGRERIGCQLPRGRRLREPGTASRIGPGGRALTAWRHEFLGGSSDRL